MFAFDCSFAEQNETASTSTTPASIGLGDASRAVFLLLVICLYRMSLMALMRFHHYHNPRDSKSESSSSRTSHYYQRHLSFAEACCPRRRARFYKCAARRNQYLQQQEQQRQEPKCCLSSCSLAESAVFYAKLHLPPPLPFHKRHKRHWRSPPSSSSSSSTVETTFEEDHTEDSVKAMKVQEETTTTDPVVHDQANDVPAKCNQQQQQTTTSPSKSSKKKRPRTRTRAVGGAALIDLARMQFWDTILRQQGSIRKRDVRHRDTDGLNSLHWACAGSPPVEVVEALLRIHPSAARKVDNDGSTALHFATHYSASLSVVQTLLKAYPEAIRAQDRHGRSPLYHAVEKRAGLDILQALVQADPSMITVPCLPSQIRGQQQQQQPATTNPQLPLARPMAARTPLFLIWSNVVMDRQARQTKRGKLWDKAQVLLEAAYRHHANKDDIPNKTHRVVSAAIAMDLYLPDQVVSLAIESHPEQLRIPEETMGQLPLAQAAVSTQYCMERTHNMFKVLLDAYPDAAAIPDSSGRTPLLLAAESGKPWSTQGGTCGILELLFHAHPDALSSKHKGLSAAFIAASAASSPDDKEEDDNTDKNPAAIDIVSNNDPFGLLTDKHHEWIQRRNMSLPLPSAAAAGGEHHQVTASKEEQLETIFQLFRADPSIRK